MAVRKTKTVAKSAVKNTEPKTAVKTETVMKAEPKTTAVKKAAESAEKEVAVKESISVQFAGKDYTTEQLVKIAKDVWEFDLKRDAGEIKEIQLYVKPEESKVYYVINNTESGSFDI